MNDPRIQIIERALNDGRFSSDTLAARVVARLVGAGYLAPARLADETLTLKTEDGHFVKVEPYAEDPRYYRIVEDPTR